jgi:acyl carrier protein
VTIEQADVSQREQVAAVLERLRTAGQPLRGVIHSAGALEDGVLASQTWTRFAKVLRAKVAGAWHLHELTLHDPLNLFVLYSSTASLLGSAGQGNHAAANAYLDALAHHRRGLGLPAATFNWGPWSEVGAAVSRGVSERMNAQGIGTIPPADGLAALEAALRAEVTQAGVIPVDWPRFLRALPGGTPPFLSRMEAARATAAATPIENEAAPVAQSAFLARLRETPAPRRREMLANGVRAEVVKVLALPPETLPDPRRPLQEMGLDSLMAVELRNNLGGLVGRPLSATLLFDFPTIETLGAHLWDESPELREDGPAEPTPAANGAAPTTVAQEVAQLSEEEVLASIAAELSALGGVGR